MSDNKSNTYLTEEEIDLVITAAIASTDASKCGSFEDWQRAVVKRATSIQRARFFNENSFIKQVLKSTKIVAKILKVEFEESSQRYVVTFKAQNSNDDKPETIRTPRMDNEDGKAMTSLIERMKEIAGSNSQVLIYKSNEMPSEDQIQAARKEGKQVPTSGYRKLSWVEFL